MAVDEDLAERMRAVLGGTGAVREVRMFGGLFFMLNGNPARRNLKARPPRPRWQRPTVRCIGAARRKAYGNGGTVDGGLYFRRSGPA
jgi:hypothetical protein